MNIEPQRTQNNFGQAPKRPMTQWDPKDNNNFVRNQEKQAISDVDRVVEERRRIFTGISEGTYQELKNCLQNTAGDIGFKFAQNTGLKGGIYAYFYCSQSQKNKKDKKDTGIDFHDI